MGINPAEQGRTLTRRQVLKEGAKLFGMTAFLAACRADQTPPQSPRSQRELGIPEPTKPPLSNHEIIKNEIKRLGIQPNTKEQQLWKTRYLASPTMAVDETNLPLAERHIQDTLNLMRQSQIPQFNKAAAEYDKLKKERLITTNALLANKFARNSIAAVTEPRLTPDKSNIQAHITFNGTAILQKGNGLTLALTIAHELEHAKNIIALSRRFSSVPAVARVNLYPKEDDIQATIEEEAKGYGVEIQGFIEAEGMLQYPLPPEDDIIVVRAANFIKNGSTTDNKGWRDWVYNNLLKIP